jgi:hypothetical protein
MTSSTSATTASSSTSILSLPDLVGSFNTIDLPRTIEYGDNGRVQITVTNKGNAVATGPITVELWISTDGEIDRQPNPWTGLNSNGNFLNYRNDALLTSVVKNINLNPGQSIKIDLPYNNITSAVAPGSYQLIANIDAGSAIAELRKDNNTVKKLVSAPGTDVVIDWNSTALNAIQAEGKAGRGVAPTDGSRLLAIVSDAVYNAVNAFNPTHTFYGVTNLAPPVGASVQAAVVGAAHAALLALLPGQTSLLNQQMMYSLMDIKDTSEAEMKGFMFGRSVAEQILTLRLNDGSQNNAPYVAPPGDYVWKPEEDPSKPNFGVAVGPNWGGVTPFAIGNVNNFMPDGLDGRPDTNPELFLQEIAEVRAIGGKDSTLRTPDQTEIAQFWAYDRADTFRPYGQINQLAEIIAVNEDNSLTDNARLFASLNTALADAVIVAWKAKYEEVQPRPDDVINGGIGGVMQDTSWEPLLAPTPPFPDYLSGHSSMGGVFAGVMTKFFGNDVSFNAVSQELPGVVRNFDGFTEPDGTFRNSFYEAGMEDALSRVYGGVHVREACIESFDMGMNVGTFVANNLFQHV